MTRHSGTLIVSFVLALAAGCGVARNMTAEEAYTKGTELFKEGKSEKAYKYFKVATEKKPEEAEYSWAAAQAAPDQNAAFVHVKSAWKNGYRAPGTLLLLNRLSFHTEETKKLEYALELYEQLPDSHQTPEFKGDIFYQFDKLDSCIALWQPLYRDSATPALCFKLANAYNSAGNATKARELLEDGRREKLLEAPGYVMLATMYALDYAYDKAEKLFAEAKSLGRYTSDLQLEHAGFLMVQGELERARKVLADILEPVPGERDSRLNIRARLTAGLVAAEKNEPERLAALRDMSTGGDPVHKAERAFYRALEKTLADSSDALESMQKVHEQLGGMPVVNLVYARQRAKAGNHKRAVKLYRSLPPLILRSPIMIVELATAQANMGEIDQALSTLSSMHAKGAFSKASLELFRDLTFRRQLNDKSKAAQTLLEKKYPGDAGVQYSGALMALREGKVDSAVSILAQLAKKHPEEERFELSRLSALLLTRDYDRVIEEINASTAPKDALASLKARAYRRKGDLPGAEEALRKGLEQRRSPRLLLEYADILIAQEKHDRAAEVYREIMTEHEEELAKDSSGNAMLLNNFAWARISSGNSDDQALDAARKAHTLAPLNPHILDTYATGLLKKGEWKECINLLEDDSVVTKEPRLLVHLATALEKRNKINRAVRTYREAYDMSASGTALPLGISREELNGRIERLLADH